MSAEAAPEVPVWDAAAGRYRWEAPAPVPLVEGTPPAPIEPAFIKKAVEAEFAEEAPRTASAVTTFADVYPRGTLGGPVPARVAPTPQAVPSVSPSDPLADWRVAPDVADELLLALPERTPRYLRTLFTLLLGAVRRG